MMSKVGLCLVFVVSFEHAFIDVDAFKTVDVSLMTETPMKASQSFVAFTVAFLSETLTALSAFERPVIPVCSEVIHHVANFRKLRFTYATDQYLVHPFGFLIVNASLGVIKLFVAIYGINELINSLLEIRILVSIVLLVIQLLYHSLKLLLLFLASTFKFVKLMLHVH